MYILRHEAHIANSAAQRPGDPAVCIIEHRGEPAYVLAATLDRPTEPVGTMYEDVEGNLWIALNKVTPDDVFLAADSTLAAHAEAFGY